MNVQYIVARVKKPELHFEFVGEFQDFGDGVISISFADEKEHAKTFSKIDGNFVKNLIHGMEFPVFLNEPQSQSLRWMDNYDNY